MPRRIIITDPSSAAYSSKTIGNETQTTPSLFLSSHPLNKRQQQTSIRQRKESNKKRPLPVPQASPSLLSRDESSSRQSLPSQSLSLNVLEPDSCSSSSQLLSQRRTSQVTEVERHDEQHSTDMKESPFTRTSRVLESERNDKQHFNDSKRSSVMRTSQPSSLSLLGKICGACHEPLHKTPLSSSTMTSPVDLSGLVMTCHNYTEKGPSCASKSPHFHLECCCIPTKSRLFQTLLRQRTSSTTSFPGKDVTSHRSNTPGLCTSTKSFSLQNDVSPSPLQFECPSCDVQGTSRYLMEYFETFVQSKVKYYGNDEECVDVVTPVGFAGEELDGCGFVRYLIREQHQMLGKRFVSYKRSEIRLKNVQNILAEVQRGPTGVRSHSSNDVGNSKKSRVMDVESERIFIVSRGSKEESRISDVTEKLVKEENGTDVKMEKDTSTSLTVSPKDVSGSIVSISDDDLVTGGGTESVITDKEESGSGGKNINTCYSDNYVDPMYFVGQPIKLYCYVDNVYHVGRIIDWKRRGDHSDHGRVQMSQLLCNLGISSATEGNHVEKPLERRHAGDFALDKEIGRIQYLVRFRSGREGRKATVHQWIFLEEHPVMVGVAVVWANVDRNGSVQDSNVLAPPPTAGPNRARLMRKEIKSNFRPAQIFVRSALEMVPVREIIPRSSEANDSMRALALFFGRESHQSVLRLNAKSCKNGFNCSKKGETGKLNEICGASHVDWAACDFVNPPQKLKSFLQTLQYHDEPLGFAIAIACMEIEEERRVRNWHGLQYWSS